MLDQKIVPMEPQSAKMFNETPEYAYQVKWDGVRLLAFVAGERVRLQGRSLKNKTALYPELATLPDLVGGKSAILDGEIIALQEGRPSFYQVMRRERNRTGPAAWLAQTVPVYYMVFDLLFFDGVSLLTQPWETRQEIISKYISAGDYLHLTPCYQAGEALLETVRERGLEGVVAKKKNSPYIPGPRHSSYWKKTKVEQTADAYVGGIVVRGKRPVSLLLGLTEETENVAGSVVKLRYIGNVSGGLSEKDLAAWQARALENKRPQSPFINFTFSPGEGYLFMEPHQKVRVTFSEWTPTLKLRAPRLASIQRQT